MFFARDEEARHRFITRDIDATWRGAAYVGNWFIDVTPQEADELGVRFFELLHDIRTRTNSPPARPGL